MKKLLAILLSVLMLCTMIPFATVFAADEYSVELVADADEVNAGDEITVEVYLYGHETVGLIAALVELGFDPAVFELVTTFDEDEEMWMPPIEVGPKFSASSNKYIMFSPIDEETGYMERCLVNFTRPLASATQAVKTNLFYTVTFKVKDDAISGTYEIDFINYNAKNLVFFGNGWGEWTWEPITITVNGSEPEVPSCEHEYAYDCSKVCSKCGEETRPEAEHQYFYACDPVCMICYEMTNPAAAHAMNHVEAKPATCTENGNIAYWYCDACGGCWDNENATGMPLNRMMVIVPAAHTYDNDCDPDCNVCFENREELAHNIIHVEAKAATCTTDGNIEYWYCDVCGAAWLDAECTLNTNLLSVILPASCSYSAVYTAAKPATCDEPGNVEYWYCANCDVYYADAACAIVTNAKNVIIPISHNVIHVDAVAATCTTDGNIEYWYCADCGAAWLDELCHLNTNLKSVVLPASCSYGAQYVEAKAATCFEPGNTEYWYCANCDVYYADAACAIVTNAKNVIIPITHNIIHVEAKDPTCTEIGNIEYWYCADCGAAWLDEYCHLNTNLQAVKLGASCSYGAEYHEAQAATCYEPGNTEYWYCANCDVYYADAACTVITNAKNVIIPITHNIIHVEAKDATCTENGNIEYWYCADCGQAWLDEYCHLNTNLMSVVLPASCSYGAVYTAAKEATCFEPGNTEYWYCANCDVYYADAACAIVTNAKNVIIPITHNIVAVEAKAPTCTENGNIAYWYCADCGQAWLDELCHLNTNLKAVVLPAAHTYANDYDVDCDICGAIREALAPVITFGGNSISETNYGLGLAFLFHADVDGLAYKGDDTYVGDYTNAYVNGCKLTGMGAVLYNGFTTADVKAVKLYKVNEDGSASFAVRVVNIPEAYAAQDITATPYITYVDASNNTITVTFGEYVNSYANIYNAGN